MAWHVCIRAICAIVSKQLMYCCAGLVMKGRLGRTSSMCHVSANQATSEEVMIRTDGDGVAGMGGRYDTLWSQLGNSTD